MNYFFFVVMLVITRQTTAQPILTTMKEANKIDVQGHRGCRGLMPENTIPAFLHAIDLGVTTLELDVVMSKDGIVIVSHEPWMSSECCLDADGKAIPSAKEHDYNLYLMTYAEIQRFDVGTKPHSRFPQQQKITTYKPSLADVIDAADKQSNSTIRYNIEVKREPQHDGVYHPEVTAFTQAVIQVLLDKKIMNRCTFQSFDLECLRIARQLQPELTIALLVATKADTPHIFEKLGFIPQRYSPYHILVTKKMRSYLTSQGVSLVPWTVNSPKDMERLLRLGVDGIITDYPDRLLELLNKQ